MFVLRFFFYYLRYPVSETGTFFIKNRQPVRYGTPLQLRRPGGRCLYSAASGRMAPPVVPAMDAGIFIPRRQASIRLIIFRIRPLRPVRPFRMFSSVEQLLHLQNITRLGHRFPGFPSGNRPPRNMEQICQIRLRQSFRFSCFPYLQSNPNCHIYRVTAFCLL